MKIKSGLVAITMMGASASSFAAVTNPFTSAVTSVQADVATYGSALVGVAAAAVGFMVAIKYVKKIARAS